jgi:hypothetical protein
MVRNAHRIRAAYEVSRGNDREHTEEPHFRESRTPEVRRTILPRTRVDKGMRKGRTP